MSVGAVECVGVEKAYGPVPALRGADLTVPESALTAVLGPSGCGKTTLLRVIAGFERIDAGTVNVSGRAVAGPGLHLPPERRRITIVPQEQALFPHLTVAENVAYGLRRRSDRAARVAVMLDMAGLSGLGDRMPHELSGGQQQRVALARALAPEPSVVLLDEPFGSLDAALRTELRGDVAAVLRASGATALLVTHDQEEALSMADSVAVMREGRIVQHAPPDEVYGRPADLWVAGFVGSANVLPGMVREGRRVECALGMLEMVGGPADGPVDVIVRPEQVEIIGDGDGIGIGDRIGIGDGIGDGDGDGIGVAATVEDRRYFGHDALVRLALGDGSHLLARTASDGSAPAGTAVSARCRGPVLCFPRGETGGGSSG